MPNKIGVAIIGVGFVGGAAHVPSFKKIVGAELVVLCAATERRVKPLAQQFNVKYSLDYDKVLEDPKVQAVVVSVPTPFHFDIALKAIKKGKHVLCEMPMAPTIEEIRHLQNAAKKAEVLLMPVLNFRFAPIYLKTKEILESDTIGKPLAFHFREFTPATAMAEQWPGESWAWDVKKSGGYPDFTLSVWSIDMFRWLFRSEIADVEWRANYTKFEKHKDIIGYNTMGVIKLSNGIVGSLHYSASVIPSASTSRLEVYGDNTQVLHAIWNNKIVLFGLEQQPQEINLEVRGTKVWGHRQMDEHFIDCLLNGRQPQVSVEDAIKAQEVTRKIVSMNQLW